MRLPLLLITAAVLTACGGGGGSSSTPTTTVPTPPTPEPPPVVVPVTYSVGGGIKGLDTSGLALSNGTETVRPAAGATSFLFAEKFSNGAPYSVSITEQPVLGFLFCFLEGTKSGTIAGADAKAMTASCGSTMARVSTPAINPFVNPYHIATDVAGAIYVADNSGYKVRKISGGVDIVLAGDGTFGNVDGPSVSARFGSLTGVAVDKSGNVFVADNGNRSIRKIATDGTVSTVAGTGPHSSPSGIAVDRAGNLFVTDYYDNLIMKIDPSGVVSVFAGSGRMSSEDGQGVAATFSYPNGICIDAADNLYVAESAGNRIRKITPAGVVTTVAGSGVFGGKADGPADKATFKRPIGVTIDSAGYLYVAELDNLAIRKISPNGMVMTMAGGNGSGSKDGPGGYSSFTAPKGIAADNRGNLFVSDYSQIRKLEPQISP